MKKNVKFHKTACTLFVLLIVTFPGVSAVERDHNCYKQELQKLEESTRRVHKEVDRILAEFKHNIAEYYRYVRGTKKTPTTTQGTSGKSWQDMKEQDK